MKIYLKILSILFVGTLMLFSSCSHNYHFATENDILTFSIIVNGEQKAGVKTVLGDTIKFKMAPEFDTLTLKGLTPSIYISGILDDFSIAELTSGFQRTCQIYGDSSGWDLPQLDY